MSEAIVLPVGGVLVGPDRFERAALSIRGGRIAEILPHAGSVGTTAFAVAGLRNAHVHLDLSLVQGVRRTPRFGDWVRDLLRRRGPFDPVALQRSAAAGAAEALRTGTTSVGDIDSSGAAAAAVAASGLRGICYREVLGRISAADASAGLRDWIDRFAAFAPGARARPGVSPHAPYSTPAALYQAARALADRLGVPLATHVAETLAEARYLLDGGGELRELLEALGAEAPFEQPPGASPIAYLESLGAWSPATSAVHANHPQDGDLERLRRAGAAVVYCPRSHNFFGHPRHPVDRYLAAGIPVALGTDSRASNASLSMFEELAFLHAARPDLPAPVLWDMATCTGARLLEGAGGRLEPGEPADLAVVACPNGLPTDLDEALEALLAGPVSVSATLVGGTVCYLAAGTPGGPVPLTGDVAEICSSVSVPPGRLPRDGAPPVRVELR